MHIREIKFGTNTVHKMKVINMTKGNDNLFYGRKELLELLTVGSKKDVNKGAFLNALGSAYHSLQNKEQRELFYMILFSLGDIPNRQHNMFGKKNMEKGGIGQRSPFMWAMEWMKATQPAQFAKFRDEDLFRQYVGLFNILATQVRTKKGTTEVTEVVNMLDGQDMVKLAEYLARIINGSNPVEKQIIAKWLVYPRTSKRQKFSKKTKEKVEGGRPLQEATQKIMDKRVELYSKLSEIMGWHVVQHKHNKEFVGLKDWKKEWNGTLESVLFSTGKIQEIDKEGFFNWLNMLPAGARYRVRRRVLDKDDKVKEKWKAMDGEYLGVYFKAWEEFKKGAQAEERKIEEKVRQGTATAEDKKRLKEVKKEAKVTTGGENLFDVISRMVRGVGSMDEAEVLSESLMKLVDFQVPVLPIVDASGSMTFRDGGLPAFMAAVVATMVMLKNPSEELHNILVRFGTAADFLTDLTYAATKDNRFMQSEMKQVVLVDRTKSFVENYKNIQQLTRMDYGGTDFNSVAVAFKKWLDQATDDSSKRVRIEMIQQFPVFLVVSDGDLNNSRTAAQSMAEFQQSMRQWFGWEGVVVLWDVSRQSRSSFEGLQNVIHVKDGFNASTVNQIFTKVHDMDIIDVYTPLKSLYDSERYKLVKYSVL